MTAGWEKVNSNSYEVEMPVRTWEELLKASDMVDSLVDGDGSVLWTLRDKDMEGNPLDSAGVQEVRENLVPGILRMIRSPHKRGAEATRGELHALPQLLRSLAPSGDGPSVRVVLTGAATRALSSLSDAYSRMHIGQLPYALDALCLHESKWLYAGWAEHNKVGDYWKWRMFRLDPCASLGVGHRHATEGKDILFSLHQVLRHRLAWDSHQLDGGKERPWTVDFDKPMQYSGSAPMSTIKRLGD